MQPLWHTFVDFLDHWQSLIAGVLVLIAGYFAYLAVKKQIAAGAKKDRWQAHCIAVAIARDILLVKDSIERAHDTIRRKCPEGRDQYAERFDVLTIKDQDVIRAMRVV